MSLINKFKLFNSLCLKIWWVKIILIFKIVINFTGKLMGRTFMFECTFLFDKKYKILWKNHCIRIIYVLFLVINKQEKSLLSS